MAVPGPGSGDFLERLLGDLVNLMGRAGAGTKNQVELAKTLAHSVATGGEPEPNVDPIARIQLEELARVAEMHVNELTGLSVNPGGGPLEIVTVGPGAWAWNTLDDWGFVLEAMSGSSSVKRTDKGAPTDSTSLQPGFGDSGSGGTAEVMARFMSTLGPMLAAMQLGSAVGHLARSTLGQYEVPIPRPGHRLLVVPQNIERFARDWSLPADQVRLWISLRELTAHAVLARPHVASRLTELVAQIVSGVAEDAAGMAERFGEIDATHPDALQRLLADPEALMGADPSPERKRVSDQLEAVTSALLGYMEHVLDRAAARLLGGRSALAEAWRRRQHERESADRAAEMLLGLDLGPAQTERGVAFVEGVVEREGEEGLSRLWSGAHALPTPSEVDAPGLWLERIKLTDHDESSES